MSSATYLVSDKNETISWTYDRLLSNATIEKKDLSLIGFITGILCIILITSTLIYRLVMYSYATVSFGGKASARSPSTISVTTASTDS